MALIIYPAESYDSFVSLADTEAILLKNVVNLAEWNLLTDDVKEVYLRQATKVISFKIDFDLIEDVESLETATALFAHYASSVDITNATNDDNVKILDIDGVIKKEYFSKSKKSSEPPDIVKELLREYGYKSSGVSLNAVRS